MSKASEELSSILNKNKEPSVKNNSSTGVFILLIIFAIIFTYSITFFLNKDDSSKKDDSKKIQQIIKENISLKEKNIKLEESISNLENKSNVPKDTKVLKQNIDLKANIKNLETKIKEQNKLIEQIKQRKIKENKKEIKQKEVLSTNKKFSKKDFNNFYFTDNSKILQCYNYEISTTIPSEECIKKVKLFLKNTPNVFRLQVIPVVSDKQISQYKNFKAEQQELLLFGLAMKRVSEVSWQIKKILGNNSIITSNNYFVKSKKGNNGFILKAYLN